ASAHPAAGVAGQHRAHDAPDATGGDRRAADARPCAARAWRQGRPDGIARRLRREAQAELQGLDRSAGPLQDADRAEREGEVPIAHVNPPHSYGEVPASYAGGAPLQKTGEGCLLRLQHAARDAVDVDVALGAGEGEPDPLAATDRRDQDVA